MMDTERVQDDSIQHVPHADRNRSIALHHANLLQQRKDVEQTILASLETLIDYPHSPLASPSTPSAQDLVAFQRLIQPFQISDYDALLEERNIVGKCGYVFCPRPFAKETRQRGKVQFVKSGARGNIRVVPSSELRKWCTSDCARRAMFVKVQLDEAPAWERAGGLGKKVEVLNEGAEEVLTKKMGELEVSGDGEEAMREAMGELALERGEKKDSARQKELLKGEIVEKMTSHRAEPPRHSNNTSGYSIEGYVPRTWLRNDEDDDDDENDTDWNLG